MAYAGEQMTCVWPDFECSGRPEVRGLCHRHFMQASRKGILDRFPAAEFFGDVEHRRWGDRGRPTLCTCELPRRGEADQCERCGRLIVDAERISYLRERYHHQGDRAVRR